MLTDEIFWKMDLTCVYHNGVKKNIENGFYVYLIVNDDKYYVGLSANLSVRLEHHRQKNTNNFNDNNVCVYILEKLNCKIDMMDMEIIWILWFCLNTDCVNVNRFSYKVRSGYINTHTIRNTNYKLFCQYHYINGIKLYNNPIYGCIDDELTYFGRKI